MFTSFSRLCPALFFAFVITIISNLSIAQNVGIGTSTPLQKLHIFSGSAGASGNAAPVIVESNTNTYINVLAPASAESGILFGRGSDFTSGGIVYNNFSSVGGLQFRTSGNTTRMLLSSTGNLGLGNTNPGFILDVSGRGRIRSGGNDATSAGFWLNNNTQELAAFIGMETDNYVGLFSTNTGVGWKFSMNIISGALKVNGSEGQAGQMLQTNGSAAAPTWSSPSKVLYNNLINVTSPWDNVLHNGEPTVRIGNYFHTFTLTGNAKALVNFNLDAYYESCVCTFSHTIIEIVVDGTVVHYYNYAIPNNGFSLSLQGSHLVTLGPGTHTIELKGRQTGPAYLILPTTSSNLIIQIVPE